MTPGRNDPCPCGSGKKFKQCHGRVRVEPDSSPEAAWRRVRRAIDDYPTMMLRFIRSTYGADAVDEAWGEFTEWAEEVPRYDPKTVHLEVFMPWFFHRWSPDPRDTRVEDAALHLRTPVSVLLERRGKRLHPVLRGYLESCQDTPFSFHEILRADPGIGVRCRDVFTGEEHEVLERSASLTFRNGDVFYGQVVRAEGVGMIEACARHGFSPDEKIGLIDLRGRIGRGAPTVSPEELAEWDGELRGAYLDLVDDILNPPPPILQNTDGEALVPHRIRFAISSSRAAFDALKHLALDETEEELLREADDDADGALGRVSFPWKSDTAGPHPSLGTTILGHIEIDGNELRVDVNSAERAERIMDIVGSSLGDDAVHVDTETMSLEDVLSRREPATRSGVRAAPPEPDVPPEVAAQIHEMTSAYYESWITQEIPALGGARPIDAVRSRVGREKTEALVTKMERTAERMRPPVDPAVFARLRERLGL